MAATLSFRTVYPREDLLSAPNTPPATDTVLRPPGILIATQAWRVRHALIQARSTIGTSLTSIMSHTRPAATAVAEPPSSPSWTPDTEPTRRRATTAAEVPIRT